MNRDDALGQRSAGPLPTTATAWDAPWAATGGWPVDWVERMAEIDGCDAYLVLVTDPATGEADTHGPFDGPCAAVDADRRRRVFDREGLPEMIVQVVRFHAVTSGVAAA